MPTTRRRCTSCSNELPDQASFCPKCGAATPTEIDRETGEVTGPDPAQVDDATHSARVQRALGEGYEVGGLLGRGGFAEVYAAIDLRLKRKVAVKVIRPDLVASETLLERFRREAEAAAQLRHPNIIPIYSVGESEGVVFFVMPLIEGETLRARLDRDGRLAIEEARRIMSEAASALHVAHRSGVVHRDIKPDNIMLEVEDRRVLLMDFGIAKAAIEAEETGLTGTGMIIGTPQYMSPEQASGERSIDHRSDIYSLGVVGFQMLTGELPFKATSVQGMIVQHITEEPPPVRELRRECPRELAEFVHRCLAKAPEDRWASVKELMHALLEEPRQKMVPHVERSREGALDEEVSPEERRALSPVLRFRFSAAAFLTVSIALLVVDLATNGALDFAPFVLAVFGFVLAAQYGRLSLEGYSWRDVFGRGVVRRVTTRRGELDRRREARDSGELGREVASVQRARNERASILHAIASLPSAERKLVSQAAPAADELLARATDLARQLKALEDRIAAEGERMEDRAAKLGLTTPTGEKDRHSALIERERAAVKQMVDAQEKTADQIESCLEALQGLRIELERATVVGVGSAKDGIDAALAQVASCLERRR